MTNIIVFHEIATDTHLTDSFPEHPG